MIILSTVMSNSTENSNNKPFFSVLTFPMDAKINSPNSLIVPRGLCRKHHRIYDIQNGSQLIDTNFKVNDVIYV